MDPTASAPDPGIPPHDGLPRSRTLRRRLALGSAALVTIVAGLSVHTQATGAPGDIAGDALYAVLVYLVVAVIAPRVHPVRVGLVALVLCAAVELFQLTGVPLSIASTFPPAALLLGSTFSPVDLLAYAAGIAVVTALDATARRALRARPVGPRTPER
ncbi:hypothetical protein B7R22_04355 [Subtercola boreus]|uniref:DUF2809 domain-containing protein n=1 Tax=Subtercola boreus TaxID=120213 RepID=A0A3E0W2V6_9MICO|nr:DUF2809 domain-containing protein [Subtercola boreus]RFA16099.1 hypothetical protein B7R22_04355 [Subtercola boreus]